MSIVRFSAIEQRGIFVPESKALILANLAALVLLMHEAGVKPQHVPADTLTDITPPYWRSNTNTFWLHTEPGEPVESCVIHVMPKEDGAEMRRLFEDGTVAKEATRTLRIPSESSGVPLLSPDHTEVGMRLHELIVPLPDTVITDLRNIAP